MKTLVFVACILAAVILKPCAESSIFCYKSFKVVKNKCIQLFFNQNDLRLNSLINCTTLESADNILRHIKTSEMFDIIKLLDFQKTLEECALKLDSLDIVTPETLYCVAQKKNLINKDNGLKLHKGVNYSNTIVRNGNLRDKMTGMKDQCKEKIAGDKFKGSQYEKTMKFMECFLPIVNYILRKLGPFKNNI